VKITVRELNPETGEWVTTEQDLGPQPELEAAIERERKMIADLKAQGINFWCIHDRSVTHSSAYWWNDNPHDPVYVKHGVRCMDCGGYIQLG
jgi:hypothetical protein